MRVSFAASPEQTQPQLCAEVLGRVYSLLVALSRQRGAARTEESGIDGWNEGGTVRHEEDNIAPSSPTPSAWEEEQHD